MGQETVQERIVEDLMKPRYKVIADWPTSEFLIGDIFTFDDFENYDVPYDTKNGVFLNTVEKYPHLFKKLEWYEERKPEEMPEYVRIKETYPYRMGQVFKVEHIETRGGDNFLKIPCDVNPLSCIYFIPATQTEYEAFISNQVANNT